MDEIVVVSGLPRSGTSMMMAMLGAGGLDLLQDGVRAPDEDNPRGYFEYEPVKRLARDRTWVAGLWSPGCEPPLRRELGVRAIGARWPRRDLRLLGLALPWWGHLLAVWILTGLALRLRSRSRRLG